MQQRELMNRETLPGDEELKLISELAGFTAISMKREALALCSRFLLRKWTFHEGFYEVVRVIGMFGSRARWATRLEAALVRQSARMQRALQGAMLTFYAGFDDWENARRFASMRKDLLPHEIAFSIEAFALAGRTREVRRLGKRIDRWLNDIVCNRNFAHSGYELGFLYYGFGIFQAHGYELNEPWLRKWGRQEAVDTWNCVDLDHPLGPASAYNAIDLLLCMALENVNRGINYIRRVSNWKSRQHSAVVAGKSGKVHRPDIGSFRLL